MKKARSEIRRLHLEEVQQIYRIYLSQHFAKNEIKPLENIEKMWNGHNYFAIGIFQEDTKKLMGYALLCGCKDSDMVLLDYYAILKEYRQLGIGSYFLEHMGELLKEEFCAILIETEDIRCAANEEEKIERERRNMFYERNGAVKAGLRSEIYTARYEVYVLPTGENLLSQKDWKEQCERNIIALYRYMVPGEKNKKFVTFWKEFVFSE